MRALSVPEPELGGGQISMMRRQGPEGTLNEGEPISLSNDLGEE